MPNCEGSWFVIRSGLRLLQYSRNKSWDSVGGRSPARKDGDRSVRPHEDHSYPWLAFVPWLCFAIEFRWNPVFGIQLEPRIPFIHPTLSQPKCRICQTAGMMHYRVNEPLVPPPSTGDLRFSDVTVPRHIPLTMRRDKGNGAVSDILIPQRMWKGPSSFPS